jgi:hypothetical protein
MGQAATGCNFLVAATENLPMRALLYKAVLSIWATEVASARQALMSTMW